MLSVALAVAVAGLVAGVTGAWSPCGFSMVETIGREDRRRAVTLAACATFTAGSLAGGAVTFGSLALIGGALHGTPGGVAAGVAAALAALAALGEARGARIVPQIRRQVPEPWRRAMALPLASALYGGLLGLGFTTFVLTWGVWALAAIALVLGDPWLGLVIGLAFGAGRALPVVALAPVAHAEPGLRAAELMAERPSILRGFRLADALALAVCALAIGAGGARAATLVASGARNPSAGAPGVLAWDGPAGGVLRRDGAEQPLPGIHPALGGALLGWVQGDLVRVVRVADGAPVLDVPVPGADALALSDGWLAYRTRSADGRDTLVARRIAQPDPAIVVTSVAAPVQLSRPSLDGDTLVYGVSGLRATRIMVRRLGDHPSLRTLRRSRSAQLFNPSVRDRRVVFVRTTSLVQELVAVPLRHPSRERILYRKGPVALRDSGHDHGYSHHTLTPTPRRADRMLFTTALTPSRALVTLEPLPGHDAVERVVAVHRRR